VGVPRDLEAQVKFLNDAGEMAVEASHEAWQAADWSTHDVAPERKGLWLAQTDGTDWDCGMVRAGVDAATEGFTKPLEPGEPLNRPVARSTKPFFLLESLKNNAFSFLANLYTLRGSNSSVSGYSGPSLGVLDLAARAVRRGDQDHALVVGAASTTCPVGRVDLARLGVVRDGDDDGYRALDARGQGLAPGDGAGALALERHADAIARDVEPHAWILGQAGASGEPIDEAPAPRPETVERAVRLALARAEAAPSDLLACVVSGLGLPAADGALLEGLRRISPHAPVPVVSWRGALGHMSVAGDLADVVLAIEALARRRVPGTHDVVEPLSDAVARDFVEGPGRAALVVATGLQGEVGAIVIAG
jgi:3-oxoacyl-(acyl-carrier-protein) synthase